MTTQPPPIASLNLKDVQGDILGGFPKKTEVYYFFKITNTALFRSQLAHLIPLIKSTEQVRKDRHDIEEHKKKHAGHSHKPDLLPIVGVNVSFSVFGLQKLSITDADLDKLDDKSFRTGQLKDSFALGDRGFGEGESFVPDWNEPFVKQMIDGVFLVAGESHKTVERKLDEVKHIFGLGHDSHQHHQHHHQRSISTVTTVWGSVRPGEVSAHEHFGFLDGISNPQIKGFDKDPRPVPEPVDVGSILVGRKGDDRAENNGRPTWALDGSFLVFRHLFQLVPEFDEFLRANPIIQDGLTPEEGSELLGARLVGRWKSGAPIDLAPLKDDPELAKDPKRNNNFRFANPPGAPIRGIDDQSRCPFAAHVRKTLPRGDLEDATKTDSPGAPFSLHNRRIMRRGIQFGPEVTPQEKHDRYTHHGRGLLFACYQSSIDDGFHFIQQSWSNNPEFPPFRPKELDPGFDAIIGQKNGEGRNLSGSDPNNLGKDLLVPKDFVIPRGGEYFFAPSIKVLRETFASHIHA